MRFKNLLGLMAIGGAVAYAHKQRGGELTLDSLKGSLNNLVGSVKGKLGQMGGSGERIGKDQRSENLGSVSDVGGVGSSSFGSDDFGTTSSGYTGGIGGNNSTRRY